VAAAADLQGLALALPEKVVVARPSAKVWTTTLPANGTGWAIWHW
jgi:hypothetical protein